MADLIATLTTDKGSWNHVKKILEANLFQRAFLITTPDVAQQFSYHGETKLAFVIVDTTKPIEELIKTIMAGLQGKLGFNDVGINIASGTGKEHMALISAVLRIGVGFRLVATTKEGVKEI